MTEWQGKALALYEAGHSKADIGRQLQKEMGATTAENARHRIQRYLKKYPVSSIAAETTVQVHKHEALENLTPRRHVMEWNGDRVIRFGLMGDTQINSKYTQLTHLHRFYDICAQQGIDRVFHTGDIDEGEQMRPGHQYECYEQGADDHVAEIVRVYPKREGITTYFIT